VREWEGVVRGDLKAITAGISEQETEIVVWSLWAQLKL